MLQEHRLHGLEKSRKHGIVPPRVTEVFERVPAADQDVVKSGLAGYVSNSAEFAVRLIHITTDVTKVGSHHGVMSGINDKGDDTVTRSQN